MQSVLNEEGFLQGILNFFDKKAKKSSSKYIKGSISRYSKDLIMSFPILADSSVSIDTGMMCMKANERNIVQMLQILFSSLNMDYANSSDMTGADIIAQYYDSIDPNMDYNDFVDLLNKVAGNTTSSNQAAAAAKINTEAVEELMKQFRAQKTFKKESINERSLNNFIVMNINGNQIIKESTIDDDEVYITPNFTRDESEGDYYCSKDGKWYYSYDGGKTESPAPKEGEYNKPNSKASDTGAKTVDPLYYVPFSYTLVKQEDDSPAEKARKEKEQAKALASKKADAKKIDSTDSAITKRIVNSDIKKANDLEPTLMVINYNTLSDGINGEMIVDKKSFLAGVKCRYVPVDSIDMIERFVSKDRTKLSLKNLIRATTGEISLVKDFLLCIDKAKMDAKNSVKKGYVAQIWNILEKRANKNNINRLKRDSNSGAAITTCILGQDTVNYMKNAYKFDIENINNAKMIINAYNLLGLIICDDSIECAKFMYDGNNEFEILSYSALGEKSGDKDYKAMINLLNKGR